MVGGYAKLMITHYSLHVFWDGVSNFNAAYQVILLAMNGRPTRKVLRRLQLFLIH